MEQGSLFIPDVVTVDGAEYVRAYPVADGRCPHCGASERIWTPSRVIAAIVHWYQEHGRAPKTTEWVESSPDHPAFSIVFGLFGSWRESIEFAGFRVREAWSREEMIAAIQAWARRHGRRPTHSDWNKAAPDHPCSNQVAKRFGSWNAALDEAGFDPQGPWGVRLRVQPEADPRQTVSAAPVGEALKDYAAPIPALAELTQTDAARLYRIINGKQLRIELATADRILTAIDRPDVLAGLAA